MTEHRFKIAPSLLAADLARLGEEVAAARAAGADMIHLDVRDHHYVASPTFGPQICAAIRPHASVPIKAHLMCDAVDARGGASTLLEVDGGIKPDNIAEIVARGCDAFVVGSAFFSAREAGGYDTIMDRRREELVTLPGRRAA